MSIFVSDNNKVVMKFESGLYASPSGTSGLWLGLVTNSEISENQGVMEIRYAGTSNRNVSQFVDGPQDYEGTLTYHPQNWRMLGFALGSITFTSGATSNTHTLSEVNSDDSYAFTSGTLNPFASFTIVDEWKGTADGKHQLRQYKGCIVDSFNLSASEGEVVECEVGYRAQSMTLGSKTADIVNIADEDTNRPYIWSDIKVNIPSGTKFDSVKEIGFTINNNLEQKHYLNGSRTQAIAVPLNRDYELTVTADAESTLGNTMYNNYWNGGSTFNVLLEGVISANKNIYISLSGCKLTSFGAPSPAEGVNEYSMTIKANSCSAIAKDTLPNYNPW